MSKHPKVTKLFEPSLVRIALKQSFAKLSPRYMVRNPVMFTVEIGTAVMMGVCVWVALGEISQGSLAYNISITAILLITVLFANFAEAIAEARGKAQADTLRKAREETPAKLIQPVGEIFVGEIKIVPSSQLRKGDMFICETGDTIPMDGEIIEGIATIDESAITGESAPVIREAGGDKSSVTGGTKVLSDQIKVQVTTMPGETFLDKMIALVEGASRQKTPNEIALTILLASFTIIFIIVCVTLKPYADYANTSINIAAYISLFVCLIPTTIGGLLSAIGIAGMDRALRANVITKSGKAVETAGDIDTLLLDKTGTITIGNRKATNFWPANVAGEKEFVEACLLASLADETPEGKSIVELAESKGFKKQALAKEKVHFVKFTAETRSSGIDMFDGLGIHIRKGAYDAINRKVEKAGNKVPAETIRRTKEIAANGGTPLVVSKNDVALGVIELQDIIKPGIQERFQRLRKMGVKTVMVTGDNPLTAKYIADKAGNMVDLDNDPTKLIEIVEIGKQLLITRGTITTFSIANDVAKYFAIVPALFITSIPALQALNIMNLASPQSAILSAVIFNAIIIPMLIPLALRGVAYKPIGASALLRRNLLIYGMGGIIVPFIGIKLIDMLIALFT